MGGQVEMTVKGRSGQAGGDDSEERRSGRAGRDDSEGD